MSTPLLSRTARSGIVWKPASISMGKALTADASTPTAVAAKLQGLHLDPCSHCPICSPLDDSNNNFLVIEYSFLN